MYKQAIQSIYAEIAQHNNNNNNKNHVRNEMDRYQGSLGKCSDLEIVEISL